MNIRLVTEADKQLWDRYAGEHPSATPYHLFAWGGAVQRAYGFKRLSLMAEDGDRVVGILPQVLLKVSLLHSQVVALPYCDVGTVLGDNAEIEAALLGQAVAQARSLGVSSLSIRGELAPDVLRGQKQLVESETDKVRMLLALPESADELWKSFKSKLRSQVRKAEKNGLSFQFANENIDGFYSVFCRNMRDLGSPVHSRKWFSEILQQYGRNVKIGLVYHKSNPIGAGVILQSNNMISIPWASTLREYNYLGPNMLLYWNLLAYAANSSSTIFDFGRSTPGEGTYKFKAQWGAKPVPLRWYCASFVEKNSQPQSSGALKGRSVVETIWQHLPLGLANLLGPKIRKYISL